MSVIISSLDLVAPVHAIPTVKWSAIAHLGMLEDVVKHVPLAILGILCLENNAYLNRVHAGKEL